MGARWKKKHTSTVPLRAKVINMGYKIDFRGYFDTAIIPEKTIEIRQDTLPKSCS
jgi:hypothetical protein